MADEMEAMRGAAEPKVDETVGTAALEAGKAGWAVLEESGVRAAELREAAARVAG